MALSAEPKSGAGTIGRDDLWTLYKVAIDDRNYQVSLTWDRTKHYFVFNVALFGVAGGGLSASRTAVLGLFALAFLSSVFAAWSIKKGHEYYRRSRAHLTRIEERLGIPPDLALTTTRGMQREKTGKEPTFADRLTIVNLAIALQLAIAAASGIALARAW